MLLGARELCQRIVEEVWNGDDYAVLGDCQIPFVIKDSLVWPRRWDTLDLVELVALVKAFIPDVRLQIVGHAQQRDRAITEWSAVGRHDGRACGIAATHRQVVLRGTLVAHMRRGALSRLEGMWDLSGLAKQVGASPAGLSQLLRTPLGEVVVRAVWRTPGVPTLFVPPMSLPGWVVWRRSIAALSSLHPVATCDLIATRRALRHLNVSPGYSVKTETRAIGRALRAAGIMGPIDVVGHSAGGTLALDFALDNPTDVRSLTLIEPGAAWALKAVGRFNTEMQEFVRDRLATYARPVTPQRYEAFLRQSYLGPGYVPSQSPLWPMLCAYMHNLKFRAALYRHRDHLHRLKAAPFPVLLVVGTESDRFHREVIGALASVLPDVEVVEMPGGHAPHLGDGLPLFHKRLARFHRRVGKRASAA